MIFGGTATVERYKGNPKVQRPRPRLQQDSAGRRRGRRLGKISRPDGRKRVSSTAAAAASIARAFGPRGTRRKSPRPWPSGSARSSPSRRKIPTAALAAFTVPGQAAGVWKSIEADLREAGVEHITAAVRPAAGRKGTLRLSAADGHSLRIARPPPSAKKEYMFPFVTVVECPQEKMIESIGPTLVCTAITEQPGSGSAS